MRNALILLLAGAGLSACASMDRTSLVEQGYAPGSLGVAAIGRQDWAAAERNLAEARDVRAGDPARLINLGRVYMATGRKSEALAAWRQALASEDQFMVETITGETVSTRELARRALALYEVQTASAETH